MTSPDVLTQAFTMTSSSIGCDPESTGCWTSSPAPRESEALPADPPLAEPEALPETLAVTVPFAPACAVTATFNAAHTLVLSCAPVGDGVTVTVTVSGELVALVSADAYGLRSQQTVNADEASTSPETGWAPVVFVLAASSAWPALFSATDLQSVLPVGMVAPTHETETAAVSTAANPVVETTSLRALDVMRSSDGGLMKRRW